MKHLYRDLVIMVTALGGLMTANAQAPSDAYRNTQERIVGTARTKAMGGAAGAIGADAGSVYINPAGMALFSRTTMGIGMDLGRRSNSVSVPRHTVDGSLGVIGMNNLSYFTKGYTIPTQGSNYLKINYGFSTGQEYNYKRDYEMGINEPSFSLTDLLSAHATFIGVRPDRYKKVNNYDPFMASVNPFVALGYNGDIIEFTEVINNITGEKSQYYEPRFYYIGNNNSHVALKLLSNKLNVSERGSRYYTDFNLGLNLNDRYFFGAAFRLGAISYSRASVIREDFQDPPHHQDPVNSYFEYATSLDVSGATVAANLGFMMAIGDYGRIGISYLTPQFAQYKELYSGSVRSRLNTIDSADPNRKNYTFETGEYRNDYGMFTPGKLTVSAMAFLSKYGMISYDFQYRNLGSAKILLGNTSSVNGVSNFIKEDYGDEFTHRVGLEIRPLSWFSVRAGYAHTGNPFKAAPLKGETEDGLDYEYPTSGMIADFTLARSYQAFTGGIGFMICRNTSIDMAYVHEVRREKVYPFSGWTDPRDPEHSFIAVKGGDLKQTTGSFIANLTIRF